MKRILISLICLSVVILPCFATDDSFEITEAITKENAIASVSKNSSEKTAEITTEDTTSETEAITTENNASARTEPVKKSEKQTEKATEADAVTEVPEEVTEDNSQPRLMVVSYEIEDGFISPEETKILTITLKNMHSEKQVSNIKLALSEDSDEIRPTGMGTKYIDTIGANKYYTWSVELKAVHTATIGEHKLSLSCEYEDLNGSAYTADDTLRIEVRQPALLDFDGAKLPVKVVQEDTITVNINLMNTGKAPLYNCKVDFDIEGLDSGGSSFVGELAPQESATANANLRIDSELTGKVAGTITISYEDSFGEKYEQIKEVGTKIEKKVIKAEKQEEKEKKNPLWWLFLLGGLILGGSLGFGIPFFINSSRQRKKDEARL
ncbi:MAG: hypothetical protein IKC01_04420 [Clostridia bacterium]|nr:hypothetical protein [Clostridia bacterium]